MKDFSISNELVVGRINRVRALKSISTTSLSSAMGKSQSTVSRILSGKQPLSLDIIDDIADVLGVSSTVLLMDTVSPEKLENANLFALMLHYARERAGISLSKAAVRTGIAVNDILELESGVSVPTREQLHSFENSYGLEHGFFSQIWQMGEEYPSLYQMFGEMVAVINESIGKCRKIDCCDHRIVDLKRTLNNFSSVSFPPGVLEE